MSAADPHACCKSGHEHEGQTKGNVVEIAGLKTYVIKHADSHGKAFVYLTDIFGFDFVNAQLIADTISEKAHVDVYIPDIIEGDTAPLGMLRGEKTDFDFMVWATKHPKDHVYPLVEKFIQEIRNKHAVTKIAVLGVCWGAWAAVKIGSTDLVDLVVTAHPSLLDMPADIEALRKPAFFACAETDFLFSDEHRKAAQDILAKRGDGSEARVYPGTTHGFLVRFDPKDLKVAEQAVHAHQDISQFVASKL
eukprot:TRINITY_DN1934_c0_g1_i2.p1 TRINITY_DN1934_c0_g1~~TRINITY_DN1934_c0_g1_i2.p1  ORF type:complete len:249 (+),score=31.77 TRINITY_DN1934_c0_g1_i2:35-781(+)